jgi:hypothetical protein
MTTETKDPERLRRKIEAILDRIDDHGSLLFCRWLLERILNDEPVPPIQELRRLRGAFVRITEGLRDKRKEINLADWALLAKYVNTGETKIGRPLGIAVKFYRTRRKLTRIELSRRCRMSVRAILALERGEVADISMPGFALLAQGLGVDPIEFMGKITESVNKHG